MNLGVAFFNLGNISKAIESYEQSLAIARNISSQSGEGDALGNLGEAYYALGDSQKAIEVYQQTLAIKQQVSDRRVQSIVLGYIGHSHLSLGEYYRANESYRQAIQIAREISFPTTIQNAHWGLAQMYLCKNDLTNAHSTIEAALQYDVPEYNHNATALHGIIALRQGERKTAQEAFTRSIAQADEILAKTPDYYSALDAKGLSICGLTICDFGLTIEGREELLAEAVKTFKRARKIAPHAGVVKSVLRLFDELVKCDEEGVLKGVREVIAG